MSGELLSSKVVIVEEEPKVRGVPSAPTSVAGAVGITERGPVGQAVLCSSFQEYQTKFGGFTQDSDLALAAMGFFENGGSQLWVVRTVHFTNPADVATATALRAAGVLTVGADAALRVEAKDVGAYGNRLEAEVRVASNGSATAFDLLIVEDGVYRESFPNLSLSPASARYVERIVNDAKTGSLYVRTVDQLLAGATNLAPQTVALTGGGDGLVGLSDADFVGSDAAKTGLHALDQVQELSLLLVPGRATPAVHQAMLAYCEVERGGTVFAVLDPPANQSATEMVTYVGTTAALEGVSEFGALYWPRVKVLNPARSVFGSSDQLVVPPSTSATILA